MLVQPVSCFKIPYINPLKGIVINYQNGGDWKSMDAPMCGFGNWWQSLWTNVCIELYLKDLSICNACRPYVGFMVKRRIKQRRSIVDQGDIRGRSKEWSCGSWANCKLVLKQATSTRDKRDPNWSWQTWPDTPPSHPRRLRHSRSVRCEHTGYSGWESWKIQVCLKE